MKIVSKALRNSARGKNCTLRIPGVCNSNPETTVLAHVPCGLSGWGMKGPDNISCYACSDCHDAIDGRNFQATAHWDAYDLIRAVSETQTLMIHEGLLIIKDVKI